MTLGGVILILILVPPAGVEPAHVLAFHTFCLQPKDLIDDLGHITMELPSVNARRISRVREGGLLVSCWLRLRNAIPYGNDQLRYGDAITYDPRGVASLG